MEHEKIICCGDRDNNDALIATLAARQNDGNSWLPMAMMNGGWNQNQWMNNPFAYLMFLAFTRNGGFGFNGDGNGYNNNALEAIRTQMQDNQNSSLIMSAIGDGFNRNDFALSQLAQNLNVDFNTLQKCCCDVQAAIQGVAGQVGFSAERVINAANLGNCNIIQALKDCYCTTQKLILEQGYQNQLAQKDQMFATQAGFDRTNSGLERGFSAVAFQAQQDKCDIIRANQDNTQRIIDTLNTHWKDELSQQVQDLKFQLSQERQNRLLLSRLGDNGCGNCGGNCGF